MARAGGHWGERGAPGRMNREKKPPFYIWLLLLEKGGDKKNGLEFVHLLTSSLFFSPT